MISNVHPVLVQQEINLMPSGSAQRFNPSGSEVTWKLSQTLSFSIPMCPVMSINTDLPELHVTQHFILYIVIK